MIEKIEYYKLRLEHTIKHNQEFTRLIYLVNAGALAFLAFLWKQIPDQNSDNSDFEFLKPFLTITALSLLLAINILHVLFLKRQGLWYRELKQSYWKLVGDGTEDEITVHTKSWLTDSEYKERLFSVSHILMAIHLSVAIALVIVIFGLLIYWPGSRCFFVAISSIF
jgi:magnesium-transporting ATPase (P-type)